MITFNDYIQEAAMPKEKSPILIMVDVLRKWFKENPNLKKSLKRKDAAKDIKKDGRHVNQIRIFCDIGNLNVKDEMDRLNCGIADPNLNALKIAASSNEGSGDYDTWNIVVPSIGELGRNRKALDFWNKTLKGIYGENGGQVQMNSLFSARPQEIELVYTIPTKGRKKDTNRNYLSNKDFVPQEFGFSPSEQYTLDKLVATVAYNVNRAPQGSKMRLFSLYIIETLKQISGKEMRGIDVSGSLLPSEMALKDVNIVNKNFGEVLCAASILAKRDSSAYATFPLASNEAVMDFSIHSNADSVELYSVKNKYGSKGTAISSINGMIKLYLDTNPKETLHDFSKFHSLMLILASKSENENRVQDKLVSAAIKVAKANLNTNSALVLSLLQEALEELANESEKMKNLSVFKDGYSAIKKAIGFVASLPKENEARLRFVERMKEMTLECTMLKTVNDLQQMIDEKMSGIAVYPVGRALTNDLNNDQYMIKCLNAVLNCASSLSQIKTNISISKDKINASCTNPKPFKTAEFRFDYNGMRKNKGNNRSIGFKMV